MVVLSFGKIVRVLGISCSSSTMRTEWDNQVYYLAFITYLSLSSLKCTFGKIPTRSTWHSRKWPRASSAFIQLPAGPAG
jgi:hypothetical protein